MSNKNENKNMPLISISFEGKRFKYNLHEKTINYLLLSNINSIPIFIGGENCRQLDYVTETLPYLLKMNREQIILPSYNLNKPLIICSVILENIKFQNHINYILIKSKAINPNKCSFDENFSNTLDRCVDKIYTLFLSISDYFIIILDSKERSKALNF
jgi:hypothetical protein